MDVIAFAEGANYNTMVHGKGSVRVSDFLETSERAGPGNGHD